MRIKYWKATEQQVIKFYFDNIGEPWFIKVLGGNPSVSHFIALINAGKITYSGIKVKLIEK